MADTDTSPRLRPEDEVRFLDDVRPVLPDGGYTLTVEHAVPTLGITATQRMRFAVAGPRFALDPGEIAGRFPPHGSSGNFGAVLPHVSLSRGTLPWERHATEERDAEGHALTRAHKQPADAPSWLALIVLDAEEAAGAVSVVPAAELMGDPAAKAGQSFAPLMPMPGDDPQTRVRVLDLPAELARALLPDVEDLYFLASARQVNDDAPHGMVMAHRLPRPGTRNFVHLVSLEHQYRLDTKADRRHAWTQTHHHWSDSVAPGATLRFVSLASWSFFCTESPGDLATILDGLKEVTLTHSHTGLSTTTAAAYHGWTPVEHRLRDGRRTAAWYRGPLQATPRPGQATLPARHADDLLRRERGSGMTDISLSAAWQLGRLLALRNNAVASAIHQWKRRLAHAFRALAHGELVAELSHSAPQAEPLPDMLTTWFRERLGRLYGVPFDYLVPEPSLFAPESFCAFVLDPDWMQALFDGAFSIGRHSRTQQDMDGWLRTVLPAPAVSGVLIRSRAVAGWPDLIVDAGGPEGLSHPVRYDRLGPDTLLALFDVKLGSVTIHPPLQAIHFGFDGTPEEGVTKGGRDVPFRDPGRRVIDMSGLASDLGGTGAHEFTAAMVEKVVRRTRQVNLP